MLDIKHTCIYNECDQFNKRWIPGEVIWNSFLTELPHSVLRIFRINQTLFINLYYLITLLIAYWLGPYN